MYRQPTVGVDLSQPTPDLSGRPGRAISGLFRECSLSGRPGQAVGADLSQPTPDLSARPGWAIDSLFRFSLNLIIDPYNRLIPIKAVPL